MSLLGFFIFVCILSYNEVASRKNFTTRFGDIYDCVDFYKQPTFSHPMLKNHNFHPLMRPSFLSRSAERSTHTWKNKLKTEGCLIGTVPIRRKTNIISNIESFIAVNEPSGTYDAGVRTNGMAKYGGGSMVVTVYNPPFVRPSTYSQARIKISNGVDAIQVGWRVDPSLRGDNRTRQFIYTDAGQSHCFDAQCGFVIVNPIFPIDQIFEPVSQPGGVKYGVKFNISRDQISGDWWYVYGTNEYQIGFWPKGIFTGLRDLASSVEWAGEVYSPPGVHEPTMGSGYKPKLGTTKYVAFFANLTLIDENYTSIVAENLEEFATDRSLYDVKDEGNVGRLFNHLVLFGGARY